MSLAMVLKMIGAFDAWGTAIYQALLGASGWEAFFKVITAFGGAMVLIPVCLCICAYFVAVKRRLDAAALAAALLGIWLMNLGLKLIFARARPDVVQLVAESSYSFPSAHAMVSAGFWPVAAFCLTRTRAHMRRYAAFGAILLCLTIGLSRVVLGVHYASDVVFGLVLGFVWSGLGVMILKKRRNE